MTLGADARAALATTGGLIDAGIAGVGTALPDRVVGNDEITPAIGVEPDWIVRRTGIRERRYAERDAPLAGLASAAAMAALADAGGRGADVDLVLVASCSQEAVMPNAAPQVAHAIGATVPGPSTSAVPARASSPRSPPRAACSRAAPPRPRS